MTYQLSDRSVVNRVPEASSRPASPSRYSYGSWDGRVAGRRIDALLPDRARIGAQSEFRPGTAHHVLSALTTVIVAIVGVLLCIAVGTAFGAWLGGEFEAEQGIAAGAAIGAAIPILLLIK